MIYAVRNDGLGWRVVASEDDVSVNEVAAYTQPVIAPQAPTVVTMRQARLALLQAGMLASVDAAVAAGDEATKIAWEYSTEVQRDFPLVQTMKASLGLTEAQLDDLFTLAAAL
jgi:hypothetical protein